MFIKSPIVALHELFGQPAGDTADDDRAKNAYAVQIHTITPL